MSVAVTALEVILANSALDFFEGRGLFRHLVVQNKEQGWTLAHAQFAVAGGFRIQPEGNASEYDLDKVLDLLKSGDIDGPPIPKDELQSRSKSDWIVTSIAILQIVWFGAQTIIRAAQIYHTTALEILTVAFVFCSIFTYAFSWHQPQNVKYPVCLEK